MIFIELVSLQLFSFCSTIDGTETDMRFVYCACSVSYMLNDWNGVNKDTAVEYIRNSIVSESITGEPLYYGHYSVIGSCQCVLMYMYSFS